MVADKKNFWTHSKKCVDHKFLPMWSFPFVWDIVQTMPKLSCAHLISLYRRQAQTDRDGASYNKTNIFTQYYEILNLEVHQNCTNGSKGRTILIILTEWFV